MSGRVRFHAEAENEILQAVTWYEDRNAGLGAEFLRSLEAVVAAIQRHPLAYPVVHRSARRAVMRKFPFTVIYGASGDDIQIFACVHGRRDAKRWQDRM
jgi:plasmid stabilization system protein ParE